METSPLHPYAVWQRISRWAVLLLIPLSQTLLFQPDTLLQRLSSMSMNLIAAALLILWAIAETRAAGYHAGEESLFYQKGLILRRRARLPFGNIDSMVVRRTVLPACFGAAHLMVDTPAGGGKRADIALTLSHRRLRRAADAIFPMKKGQVVYRASGWRVLLMAASWSNPGTGLLLLAPFVNRVGQVLGQEIGERLYATVDFKLQLAALGLPPAAAGLAGVLTAGWGIAMLVQLFRYGGFQVSEAEGFLSIRRGVVATSRRIFRPSRLNALSIRQTLLMSLFGLRSSYLHVVGAQKEKGDRSMLTAAASRQELDALLGKLLPGVATRHKNPIRPPKKAEKSYLLAPILWMGGVIVAAAFPYLFGQRSQLFALSGAFALPVLVWWLLLRYQAFYQAGLSVDGGCVLVSGCRRLTMFLTAAPLERVQMAELRQNPFQQHAGTCTVRIYLYGERREYAQVKHLERHAAQALLDGLFPAQSVAEPFQE